MRLTPRKAGYLTAVGPKGTFEYDTFTCAHCSKVKLMRTNDPAPIATIDPGGGCRMCDHHICGPCVDLGVCTPFMRKLEAYEARSRLLEACRG